MKIELNITPPTSVVENSTTPPLQGTPPFQEASLVRWELLPWKGEVAEGRRGRIDQ